MVKRFACAAACVLAASTMAYAGSVDTYGIGARATALGGAYAATADDPFAAYYNPAGLSQIEGKVFSVGALAVDPTIEMSQFTVTNRSDMSENLIEPTDFSDDSDLLVAPHLGYAQKISERFALGVAAYAPWGMELDWEKDPTKNPGSYSAYHSYYKRYGVTPSLSYKVNDKLSFGVGVTIGKSEAGADTSKYLISNTTEFVGKLIDNADTISKKMGTGPINNVAGAAVVYANAAAADPEKYGEAAAYSAKLSAAGIVDGSEFGNLPSPDHQAAIGMELEDDVNYSYNIGVMYKPKETITLGLTYRSECDADFEGDVFKDGVKVATATMDYNHPQQIQAGVRYQPHDKFSIECDLVWTDWSINKDQVSKLSNPIDIGVFPGADPIQSGMEEAYERDWEDTKQLRFGMEYIINDMITVRGGYFYDPTPIPDNTLDMQWPDADKKTYSLGAGFNFGRYTIDAVFQYTDIEQARVVGGESTNLNESFAGNVVSASADGYIVGGGVTLTARF
ncbi:OmpP1/FadL family transporter [Desulfoluna butyratoxydans]|uniref:Outer membrane protein transport protein (Ompp1/fadl/todx) n=1 Tax=Desulfoluna butyratoxydans TaxID=231438 RepID=A0A4V6IL76_9BACT|nr:outer membrane protein transport protein [Desulfoluna butyratoxydans]VFQ44108.1 outer membrane protein transport protein (ompp1/fadl/todx) [Desulfoluna butyratoxydans]